MLSEMIQNRSLQCWDVNRIIKLGVTCENIEHNDSKQIQSFFPIYYEDKVFRKHLKIYSVALEIKYKKMSKSETWLIFDKVCRYPMILYIYTDILFVINGSTLDISQSKMFP